MSESNVTEAIRMFYAGLIPLRAAAWCLMVHRSEEGAELTSSELAERLGVHAKSASRTLAELKRFARLGPPAGRPDAPETHKPVTEMVTTEVTESVTGGNQNGYQTHKRVTEMVTPPHTPPYKDFPLKGDSYTHIGEVTESVTRLCDPSEDVRRACAVLGSNLQTEPLSGALARSAHLDRVRALASDGWRLESAARKFLDPCEVKEAIRAARNTGNQLKYLLTIAEGLDAPYGPRPAAPLRATGTAPGGYVPPSVARRQELKAQAARLIAEAEARDREGSGRD